MTLKFSELALDDVIDSHLPDTVWPGFPQAGNEIYLAALGILTPATGKT